MSEGNPRDFQGPPTPALSECHDTVWYQIGNYLLNVEIEFVFPPPLLPHTRCYTQSKKSFGHFRTRYGYPPVSTTLLVITEAFSVRVKFVGDEKLVGPLSA